VFDGRCYRTDLLTWLHVVIAASVIGAVGLYLLRTVHRPSRQYVMGREADPDRWSRLYSPDDLPTVEDALAAVTSSFLLRPDDAARLLPDDRLMDVYRAAYPNPDAPDTLEFETLWKMMQAKMQPPERESAVVTNMTVKDVVETWLRDSRRRRTRA
jgi:transcriptional regulator of nitric oxide reductase